MTQAASLRDPARPRASREHRKARAQGQMKAEGSGRNVWNRVTLTLSAPAGSTQSWDSRTRAHMQCKPGSHPQHRHGPEPRGAGSDVLAQPRHSPAQPSLEPTLPQHEPWPGHSSGGRRTLSLRLPTQGSGSTAKQVWGHPPVLRGHLADLRFSQFYNFPPWLWTNWEAAVVHGGEWTIVCLGHLLSLAASRPLYWGCKC